MEKKYVLSELNIKNFVKNFTKCLATGDVICLYGNLGAGKSSFARALIRELSNNYELEVPSPTFTLVQQYDTPKGGIWHFDLYRLEHPEEVIEIGFDEAVTTGISIIEWPEKLDYFLPEDRIDCHINFIDSDDTKREYNFITYGNCKIEI